MKKTVITIPADSADELKTDGTKQKLRVACYCRVSTDREEQENSFSNQVMYYTNLINSRSDWVMAGVFTDEGISGTGTKKRKGFMEMIDTCEKGGVDFIITKSISRFARNAADSIYYSRKLKNLGIPIYFEKERINTMDATGELMFNILSSFAQEESRNISENTKWGIRSKFKKGIPQLNCKCFLGYDKDKNGNLVVNKEQAKVVRRIFYDFMAGWSAAEISKKLNEEKVPWTHGRARWQTQTLLTILKNEKYVGDILMQKTYTYDYLTKKEVRNHGELEQYYIKDDHEGIVSREIWDATQLELKRRDMFRRNHGIKKMTSYHNPLCCKVFCAFCGGKYMRRYNKRLQRLYWKCENSGKRNAHACSTETVSDKVIKDAVTISWNRIVVERLFLIPKWKNLISEGNALERYRARHMIAATADGEMERELWELTRMFLEEIIVEAPIEIRVKFLDGTIGHVKVEKVL